MSTPAKSNHSNRAAPLLASVHSFPPQVMVARNKKAAQGAASSNRSPAGNQSVFERSGYRFA
jgi:hypothetical protein